MQLLTLYYIITCMHAQNVVRVQIRSYLVKWCTIIMQYSISSDLELVDGLLHSFSHFSSCIRGSTSYAFTLNREIFVLKYFVGEIFMLNNFRRERPLTTHGYVNNVRTFKFCVCNFCSWGFLRNEHYSATPSARVRIIEVFVEQDLCWHGCKEFRFITVIRFFFVK